MKAHQLRIGDKFFVPWLEFIMTAVAFSEQYIEARDDDGQTIFISSEERVWTHESHPYAF